MHRLFFSIEKKSKTHQNSWRKSKWELHKSPVCCFELILEAALVWSLTSHHTNHPSKISKTFCSELIPEAVLVQPLSSHHTNHPSKINETFCPELILEAALVWLLTSHHTNHPIKSCWALLEKQGQTHKWRSPMYSYTELVLSKLERFFQTGCRTHA